MFIRLLFRRFRIKENKYLMGIAYGAIYFTIFFSVFSFGSYYMGNLSLFKSASLSLFVGMIMFVVYLIKWELWLKNAGLLQPSGSKSKRI
ncbi:MAG: hypothetical protein HGA85_01740 [Nanoarchaeota archaeon]|nr:hypothetical protein [Nanoarchaeota archaeon]